MTLPQLLGAWRQSLYSSVAFGTTSPTSTAARNTAADVHHGRGAAVQAGRAQALTAAYYAQHRTLRPQATSPAGTARQILDQPNP